MENSKLLEKDNNNKPLEQDPDMLPTRVPSLLQSISQENYYVI